MNLFSKIFRIASAIFTGIMIISMSFMIFPLSKVGDVGTAIILMIAFWIYNLICLITNQNIIYEAITTGDVDVGAFFGTIGKGLLLIPKGIWWLLTSLFFIILIPFRYLFVGIKKLFGKDGGIKSVRKKIKNKKNSNYNFEIENFIKEYARKYGRKITFDQARILYSQEQAREERKKEFERKKKELEKQTKKDKQQFEKDNKENIKNINKIVKDISLDRTWFDDIISDPYKENDKFNKLYAKKVEDLKNALQNYFKEQGITKEEINKMFNKQNNTFNLPSKYNLNNIQTDSKKERERKELLFQIKSKEEMRKILRLFNSCNDNPDDYFVVAKSMRAYYVKHNIEELYNNCEYNNIPKEVCDVAFAIAAKKGNKTPQDFKTFFEIDANINTLVDTSKYKDYIN